MLFKKYRAIFILIAAICLPLSAYAYQPNTINHADTAWMLTAAVLILLMTSPGIILFYTGMVHQRNTLSVLAQGFLIAAIMSVLWIIGGYSLSFSSGNVIIGGFHNFFLANINEYSTTNYIPTYLFIAFQMGFAIVAPALMIGGVAERMKIRAILIFMILWEIFSFYPVCHWVWGYGWLADLGVLDYAGGLVVHVNAGFGALILAIVLGRRSYLKPNQQFHSHNLNLVMIGSGLLWIGWFGFNAGSSHASDSNAALALLNTQISASIAALTWTFTEWKTLGKPSIAGLACAIISGLVAITPAAGYVGPIGALVIGGLSGFVCFYASRIKHHLRYDDSLDAFAVHAAGGVLGSLLVSVFALKSLGGVGLEPGVTWLSQLGRQAIGVASVLVWSSVVTFIILMILKYTIGLKIAPKSEIQGIDRTVYSDEVRRL